MGFKLRGKSPAPRSGNDIPPIVVRNRSQKDPNYWKLIEAELAPVLTIMNQLGLTAAGFKVAAHYETGINSDAVITNRGDREKLLMAREAIRDAGHQNGIFWTLPNPVLYYNGLAVELFGDRPPGVPWEHTLYRSGPVTLVAVQAADAEDVEGSRRAALS